MDKLITKVLIALLDYIKVNRPDLLQDVIEDAVNALLRKHLETISTSVYKGIFK